ncbi:MAG: AraC family transcriptional regulator [Alphaproteobacteria bacterium]|nr:AraC family transcriptional regulator [Alphaproteobacteria bacterium]
MAMTVVHSNTSTVLGTVTFGLEELIEQQGGESSVVLLKSGLQSQSYKKPNHPISLQAFCNSMHEAAHSTGNEHFGLSFGATFKPEGLGVFGYQAITAPTLRDALNSMVENFDVFQKNSLLKFSNKQGICTLEYRLLDGNIMDRRQDAEVTIGMLYNILTRCLGENWSPLEIQFQHPALVNADLHREAYHCNVTFQRASNFIFFRESCLDCPMPNADPILHDVILDTMTRLSSHQEQKLTVAQRVKSEIIDLLPSGNMSLEQIAQRLFKSTRSLQRQLTEEQSSYATLLDEARHELADYYLSYDQITLSEVAFRLGYSELSAFTRAFIRWKSMSPSQWRQKSVI